MSTASSWVSPLSTVIETEGDQQKLWVHEARDLARGFCGALFLALPLLYTLEMWERARVVPSWDLVLTVVLIAYFGNVGFVLFNGFKPEPARKSAWFDALSAMGIGLLAAVITLYLIGRYTLHTPPEIMVKLLLLEMVPCSFGASLAINQLGARKSGGGDRKIASGLSTDARKLLGTALGATMFAFNVAPTVEPQLVTYGASWWHTLALLLFSLAVSFVMVFFAGFVERDDGEGGVLRSRWTETIVSYLLSLAVAGLLLWMFGYLSAATPPGVAVPWIVTMGYVTTLAGSAGRLVL